MMVSDLTSGAGLVIIKKSSEMGKDSGVGLPCPNGRCHSKPSQTSTPKLLYEKSWPWSANAGTSYPAGHFSYVFLLCTQGRK